MRCVPWKLEQYEHARAVAAAIYSVWHANHRMVSVSLDDGESNTRAHIELGVNVDVLLMIESVTPGSPADRAGMRTGEYIKAMMGHRVKHPQNDEHVGRDFPSVWKAAVGIVLQQCVRTVFIGVGMLGKRCSSSTNT